MAGGYINLSSSNNFLTLKNKLMFILIDFKLKYNVYYIRKHNKCIINIDIFIADEQRLLLRLTNDLQQMEKRIEDVFYNQLIQINYKDLKKGN